MHKLYGILFIIAFAAATTNVIAQEKESKKEFRFNMGYDFGLKKGMGGSFSFHPEIGWNLSDQFYLGIVSGVETDKDFKNLSIPIYVHPEVSFDVSGNIVPFVGFEGGIDINTKALADHVSGEITGSINPMIGIKTPIGKNTELSLAFGYTRTIISGGGGDYLGFKVGVNFGMHGNRFRRFMSNSLKSIELETMTAAKDEEDGCSTKTQGQIGFRYSILFPVVENLYIGPSIAIGIAKDSYSYGSDIDNWSETSPYGYVQAQARARYQVKELTFAEKFLPFVQVDAGLGAIGDAHFSYGAAVGLSYEVGSENSVELTLGYSTAQCEKVSSDGEYTTKGVLRIALGYSF